MFTVVMCSPTLLFTLTSFLATPTKRLAVQSPSLGVYHYNNLDMRTFCEQNFTIVSASYSSISIHPTFYPWE